MNSPINVYKICRGCGALCLPFSWEERGGLCPRCAAPVRVKTPPAQADADPIGAAIDRELLDLAKKTGGDS